jgi:hypothetical protein
MQYNIFVDVQLSKEVIKRSKQKTDDKVKNNKYWSVKHYTQEAKDWATGTLQNTTLVSCVVCCSVPVAQSLVSCV